MNSIWRGNAKVQIMPGSPIDHAARDAVALAKQIGGVVSFEFNGIELAASADSDPAGIVASFHSAAEYNRLAQSLNGAAK